MISSRLSPAASRPLHFSLLYLSLLASLLLTTTLHAEDKPQPRSPDRHELWVPTKDWNAVLAKHPSAVMLTPEQYDALVRDAGKITAPKPDENLPARAVIESLRFKGSAADESSASLKLEGELTLRCLTDEWTEVTARLPFRNLASATVDGSVVLGLAEETRDSPTTQRKLLVRGIGTHRISVQVLGKPGTSALASTRSLAFYTSDVPAVLELRLPTGATITSGSASYTRTGDLAQVLLHSPGGPVLRDIAWTTSSAITQPARQASASGIAEVTDHSIETAWSIAIQRSTTDTANTLAFDVIPADAVVLSAEGEGITKWQQNGARLEVTLRDRTHTLALTTRVRSVIDLQSDTKPQSLALPTLRFAGQLATDPQARIGSIAEGVTLMAYEGATPQQNGVIHWNPVRDTLKLLLRKADPRIVVDADAHISVTHDDVLIDRTLAVQTDRPVTELRVILPAGEEFLSTASKAGPTMDWKRSGQVIEYRWSTALNATQPSSLTLATRKRLTTTAASNRVTIESLTIPEAKKLAGYVALDFDPTWRVSVQSASGLEDRDARTTPVKGKMAWFALRSFKVEFDVQRRDPVFDADTTAYALPRAKTVEIEGEVVLNVSDAPLRQLKLTFDKISAPLVRFTSPLVGEQQLDAATGVWSLTLRKESLGRVPLRFRLSLPSSAKPEATSPDGKPRTENRELGTIEPQLPRITINSVRRQHGIWVIEANTDTELTFDSKAMQPLDVLRVPAISDYQPRHRVVAAFDYGSAEATLTLHAARHGHSELAAVIVRQMKILSVLSRDGSTRHDATFDVQHSGEQFINVRLPDQAQLLTALAAAQPVKPVRGPDGTISIPLPPGSANHASVPVRLLYETTGPAWSSRGQRPLDPPTLAADIPILATDWQVYAPDGFGFQKVDTQMVQEGTGIKLAGTNFMAGVGQPALSPEHSRRTEDPETARDQTRSRMLNQVTEAWETKDHFSALYIEKLKSIRLPSLTFKDASIEEAIDFLRTRGVDLDTDDQDPARKGINFILKSGDTPSTAKITLDLKDVPLDEALRYVTELAGMKYKIEPHAVVIVPVTESTTEQFTRVYKVPPDFLSLSTRTNDSAAADPFAPGGNPHGVELASRKAAKEVLGENGIPFPEGASAVFNPVTSQLIVRNSAPNLDLVDSYVEAIRATSKPEAGIAAIQFAIDWPESDKNSPLVERMRMTRLHRVAFSEATLQECAQYLSEQSKTLDPTHKGVPIEIASGAKSSPATVTLDLKDVPLEEAIRYVTELAGMKMKVEPSRVLIVSPTESVAEMATRTWAVPSKFMAMMDANDGGTAVADPFAPNGSDPPKRPRGKFAKSILTDQGIVFPEGASTSYDASQSRLTVKNTSPNLDLVEAWLAYVWNNSGETPPISDAEVRRRQNQLSEADSQSGSMEHLFPTPVGVLSPGYAMKSGLLPLELELPAAGQLLRFHGPQAPTSLMLPYVSAQRQMLHAIVFLLIGAALFMGWGRRHAFLRSVLVVVLFGLGIGLLDPEWQPLANALLIGWFAALILTRVWKLIAAFEAGQKEVVSAMKPSQVTSLLLHLSLLTSLLAAHTHAAEPPPPADPAAHTVLIPFDQTKPLTNQKPQRYYLDRADFDRLWAQAKENRKPEKVVDADDNQPSAVLHSALYRATIEAERFVLEAQFDITSRGRWAKLPLVVKDSPANASLPLRELIIDGKPGAITGDEVTFENAGHHIVLATYEVAHKRGWSQVLLSPPVARAAMASIRLPDTDALPEFSDAKLVAVEETRDNARFVTVGLGSADKLHFTRVPRRPVSEALPPSAEVTVTTSLTGEMRLHGVVKARFIFPGAARREVALTLDKDWTLDGTPGVMSGEKPVRDVRVALKEDAGAPQLVASFPHEVSDEVTLELHLTPNALNLAKTPFIAPRATKWDTTARLIAQDGVQLNAKPTATQQRLDNEDYSYRTDAGAVNIPVIRYRLGQRETLAFETKPADAKTSARIDYVYQLSEQKQELAAAIALKRERGAWRQLRVTLPTGMEVQGVNSPQLSAWELHGSDLYLRFSDATGREARVVVYVANAVLKPTPTWTLAPLRLPDVAKLSGTAIVAAHAAIEARLDGFKAEHDLREIDPATQKAIFIITPPLEKKRAIEFERAAWTLNVTLQDQPTRFSADGVLLGQATDQGILLSQQIALNVEQGALKRVIVRLPKSLPEATVTGEQLRDMQSRVVGEQREYECTFQSQGGLLGSTALTFDMQLPLTDAELKLPFVEVADVERLRRFFVLDNSSSRESKTLQADGVDPCAKDALPYVPNVLTQPQFYQGRPSGGLAVAFTQLQASGGNAAIVTLADITTVLRADGERWDTVVYSLSNRSLQFLPVVLPDKAELMAVSVSGEAVRADEETRTGRRVRLIPLIQTKAGERSMEVKLVYRLRGSGLPKQVKLDDPELVGISAERTVWNASLPPGWTLKDTSRETFGNMEPIAEEGRDIEKLQSWMSDLGRINRVLSSSKNYDDNNAALAEAEKLNKDIQDLTHKVQSKRRSTRYAMGAQDEKVTKQFEAKTDGDLSKVNEELSKQTLVLTENRKQNNTFAGKQLTLNGGVLGNGWAQNTYTGGTTINAGTLQVERGQALNDNVSVANGFFTGKDDYEIDLNLSPEVRNFEGFINNGSPINTKAVDALGKPATAQLTSNAMPQPLFNTSNVFGVSSNARAKTIGNSSNAPAETPALVALNSSTGSLVVNGSVVVGRGSLNSSNVAGVSASSGRDAFGGSLAGTGLPAGLPNQLRKNLSNSSMASISLPEAPPDLIDAPTSRTMLGGSVVSGGFGNGQTAEPKPDGQVNQLLNEAGKKAEAQLAQAPSPATPAPMPAAAAPMSPADPFGAAPSPAADHMDLNQPTSEAAKKLANQAVDLTIAQVQEPGTNSRWASQPGMIRATAVKDGYVTTAAVNQLRPTGRRSLQVEVPLVGETYHFRKLKDHAVLDLMMKKECTGEKTMQTTLFGTGLGVWALMSMMAARWRKRQVAAI